MSVATSKEVQGRSKDILNAALKVFTEVGYHDARISDIAERAGVAKGTVYLYFSSKQQLFQALIEDIMAAHLDAVSQAVAASGSLRDKLLAIADKHVALFKSKKDLARLNVHEAILSDRALKQKLIEFQARYRRLIATALEQAQAERGAAPAPMDEAAIAFTGMLNSFGAEMIFGQRRESADALADRLVDLFLNGFDRFAGC